MIQGLVKNVTGAINEVVSQAADAVQDVTQMVDKAVDGDVDYFRDRFDVKEMFTQGKEIFSDVKEFFQTNDSLGRMASAGLDKLGLPDWASSFAGAAVDFMTLNPGGMEQVVEGIAYAAGDLGMEGFSEFLHSASDVVGMAASVGGSIALTVATGGAGAPGMLASLGQLGKLGQIASTAGKVAGHVKTAMDVVDGIQNKDLGALSGVLDGLGGAGGALGDMLGHLGGGKVGDVLSGVFGDGGDLLGTLFDNFDLGSILGDSTPELLDQLLNLTSGEHLLADLMGGELIDFGKELASMVGKEVDLPGTELFSSPAAQTLLQVVTSMVGDQVGEVVGSSEIPVDAVVSEAGALMEGLMNVAGIDSDVATSLMNLLMQMGSMNQSSAVSDLMGAFVRA